MFKEFRKEIEWGGRTLVLESGKIARQADGAVMATYGDTKVLCTVVGEQKAREGVDFFPLAVHYQEKTFAAGKIPGGFFKREGRPGEKETLTSRLIDRPISPLFPEGWFFETQIIAAVLSSDKGAATESLGIVGASAAVAISDIPFPFPVGAVRVGRIDGKLVINPTLDDLEKSDMNIVVAGTSDAVMMVESESKELSEEVILEAIDFCHPT